MTFNWKNNRAIVRNPREPDFATLHRLDRYKQSELGQSIRHDEVMIHMREGKTDDNVTGLPPKFKQEDRDRWAARREQMEIERLFRP